MCPRMDCVSLIEAGQMFLGEGTEASCGPQFASAKAAGKGVDELLSGKENIIIIITH